MIATDRITADFLEATGGCVGPITVFRQAFPDGLDVTRPNLLKAADEGLSSEWFAKRLLEPATYRRYVETLSRPLAAFKRTTRPARIAYSNPAHPAFRDVATYAAAAEPAKLLYFRATAEALSDFLDLPKDGPCASNGS